MARIKNKNNNLYEIADNIRVNIIDAILDKHLENDLLILQNENDSVYGLICDVDNDEIHERHIIALKVKTYANGEKGLCAFLPPNTIYYNHGEFTPNEVLKDDYMMFWYNIDRFDTIYYLQTISNIAETIEEYL